MPRDLDFSDTFTSATDPGQGNSIGPVITNTFASPGAITVAGITPADKRFELIFIEGDGGSIDVTADPQIAAGTVVGDRLIVMGGSGANVNDVVFEDGNGLKLNSVISIREDSKLLLLWDGVKWSELQRFG